MRSIFDEAAYKVVLDPETISWDEVENHGHLGNADKRKIRRYRGRVGSTFRYFVTPDLIQLAVANQHKSKSY